MKIRWIACDLDHTLFDSAWRDPYLGDPTWPADPRWDEYNRRAAEDKPFPHVIDLLKSLEQRWNICMLTARPVKWRTMTKISLVRYQVPYHELLMRPAEDSRPSPALKMGELMRRFGHLDDIDFVIDDREDVAKFLASKNVSVLQAHIRRRAK
jgi:phosphoglycolate phosphatase-like HAD superfamily hydrolase